jgi:Gluconate 2-dehydrogenase subunit 3
MNGVSGGGNMNAPIDPFTHEPLKSKAQPGYYPGYQTLDQRANWDAATRAIILERLLEPPPIRFFSQDEARLFEIICDHILPQEDRDLAHRIPIVPYIDRRLYEKRTSGQRFEDMPPDGEAHRLGLQAIDEMAQDLFRKHFPDISWSEQEVVLESVHDGKPVGAPRVWERMPVHRYWQMLVQDCVDVYYAHPWSWDEIGYGGPAYPRGYMRLEHGEPEPWEIKECRYEWQAPIFCRSELRTATNAS